MLELFEFVELLGDCGVKVGIFVGNAPGVAGVPEVGKGGGVFVGRAVGAAVSVGGIDVAVGRAASVCATIVNAPASAVCWISTGLAVGAACGAHALTSKINTTPMINTFRFIC